MWVDIFKSQGGYSQKNWVRVCGWLPKTLLLFMTKICDFPDPLYRVQNSSRLPATAGTLVTLAGDFSRKQ